MQVSWFSFIFYVYSFFFRGTKKTRALTTVASYKPTLGLSSGYHKYFLLLFPGQVSINFFFFHPTLCFSSVIFSLALALSSRVDVIASGNARMRPAAAAVSLREKKKRERRLRRIGGGREMERFPAVWF